MNLATDRALVPAGSDVIRYLTVTLTAPDAARTSERPAVSVALVLDRSGSMEGTKLQMARKAATHAVRLLADRDRLAVVAYDDEVETVVGNTPASAEAKTLAEGRLKQIDARGCTDLAGGWVRGLDEAAARSDGPEIRRVLLLSDGLANRGETDPDALAGIAAAWRARGVATTTFGVGADFDETLMARLAREGGGNFYFVEHPRQIPDYFASELGEALDIVARDATFDVACGPGVSVALLNDFPVEKATGAPAGTGGPSMSMLRVRLGDLVSRQRVSLVFAVRIPALRESDVAGLECGPTDRDGRLTHAPNGGTMPPMAVTWTAVAADQDAVHTVDGDVLIAAAKQVAARAKADALVANRREQFARATQILATCAAGIREMASGLAAAQHGSAAKLERIASELEQQAEDFSETMAPMAMKAVLYQSANVSRGRDQHGKARRT